MNITARQRLFNRKQQSLTRPLALLTPRVLFDILQLWVGILVHSQPFFIAGIEDAEEARANAFGAMGMFLVTFFASLAGIWHDSKSKETSAVMGEGEYYLSQGDIPTTYGTST